MIILEKFLDNEDTVFYGDVISNGKKTFHFNKLTEACEKFNISDEQKLKIVDTYLQNLDKDNINEYVNINKCVSRAHQIAVAVGTENPELIEYSV